MSTELGWALGTAPCTTQPCTSVVRTRDGGRSWQGIPAPKASLGGLGGGRTNGAVSVLRFADARNGWAGVDGLYSTHDGGATWHRQHIGGSGSAVTAIATGGGEVYATVGCPEYDAGNCTPALQVYASAIGADHWNEVASGIPGVVGDSSLRVQGATWYISTEQAVYRGTSSGAVTRLTNPCPAQDGSRSRPVVAVVDSRHLDAVCLSDGAAGSASYQLYGTTDGARTWHRAGGSRRGPSDVNIIADNANGVLLLAASSGDSEILRTTDDGVHVTTPLKTTVGGGREWADLGFTTTTQGFVVLPGASMYFTRDAGASFAKVGF